MRMSTIKLLHSTVIRGAASKRLKQGLYTWVVGVWWVRRGMWWVAIGGGSMVCEWKISGARWQVGGG